MVAPLSSNNNLSSYFTNLITQLMNIEEQPLNRLTAQRDTVTVQRGVYVDLNTNITDLKTALQPLISTSPFYTSTPGRSTQVTNAPSGSTVFSATASNSAVTGQYDIQVNQLAKAQRLVSTTPFTGVDQPVGIEGNILLGGNGTAALDVVANTNNPVTATLSSLASGQRELGTGQYTIETQMSGTTLQFRLKDADGKVVPILDSKGNSTSSWQTAPATGQTVDTGRGLTFTFTGKPGVSEILNYTAAGVTVKINKTDTLADVANNINDSLQPDGHTAVASIIGDQLVLSSANTGTNHEMIYTDNAGFGLIEKQTAQNAKLTVNKIDLERQSNVNLTDVVYGVTLNLAEDAVGPDGTGKSATLNITSNNDATKSALDTFITKFNGLEDYIAERTAITKVDDKTFSRGPLADDTSFSDLRSNLMFDLMAQVDTGGKYKSLADIGITLDDNLKVSVSDSDKLAQALEQNPNDVTKIMDSVFGKVDSELSAIGGTTGYLNDAVKNLDINISDLGTDITNLTDQLNTRQTNLVSQYADMQAQLQSISYTQQTLNSFYGTSNSII